MCVYNVVTTMLPQLFSKVCDGWAGSAQMQSYFRVQHSPTPHLQATGIFPRTTRILEPQHVIPRYPTRGEGPK